MIGEISASGNINVQTDTYERVSLDSIFGTNANQTDSAENLPENQQQPLSETPADGSTENGFSWQEEPYINLEYAQSGAEAANMTVDQYISSLMQAPDIGELPFPELYDQIIQYQDDELAKIFGEGFLENTEGATVQESPAYPVIPATQPLPDIQENSQL